MGLFSGYCRTYAALLLSFFLDVGGKPDRTYSDQPELVATVCLQPAPLKWIGWSPRKALIPQLR